MRSVRSTTALLAILVTAWVNLTAQPCGAAAPAAREAPDPHAQHAHGQHHADAPQGHFGPGCAVLMSCGAVPKPNVSAFVQPVAPPLGDAPIASILEPSAADLGRDTPPPRRHA